LAQGLLTERYLKEIPENSRAAEGTTLFREMLSEENLSRVRALADIAARRHQKISQLALAWALRDPRVTSLVIGASSVAQLEENVAALDDLSFTDEELAQIDTYAVEGGIDLWRGPATS
jgi:L-glyceraldehyde 3-phosphate reductase